MVPGGIGVFAGRGSGLHVRPDPVNLDREIPRRSESLGPSEMLCALPVRQGGADHAFYTPLDYARPVLPPHFL